MRANKNEKEMLKDKVQQKEKNTIIAAVIMMRRQFYLSL